MSSTLPIDAPRLVLEPLRATHAAELFVLFQDARLYEYIEDAAPANVEALAERLAFMAAGPPLDRRGERWVNYAVRCKDTARLIGRVESTLVDNRAEVAYLFDPHVWGQGYAAEAMRVFQEWLTRELSVDEFWATTGPQNTRSIRLLQRLGYAQVLDSWPPLLSYVHGDLVFVSNARSTTESPKLPL